MIHISFHKKNTSEKIKEATINLLSEHTYDEISMRKIAKEANVALGQLTYYYRTKENLIVSVVKEVFEIFYDEFEENISKSGNKVSKINEGVESILKDDSKIDSLLINILTQSQKKKKIQTILREFWTKIINFITNCYVEELNLTKEEANLKARFFIGGIMENIVENILDVKFEVNNNVVLIDKK